jgi:hypothetical protein
MLAHLVLCLGAQRAGWPLLHHICLSRLRYRRCRGSGGLRRKSDLCNATIEEGLSRYGEEVGSSKR